MKQLMKSLMEPVPIPDGDSHGGGDCLPGVWFPHVGFLNRERGGMRFVRFVAAVCALCLGCFAPTSAHARVKLVEQSVVTDEGLHFWYPNGEKAYHYAASISPRGDCYTVAKGYVFFGWYKGGMDKRDLMISRKKIGSGEWVTVQLPHKNTLIGAKRRWGESHNTISVGVSTKDGTIHIFYDHHNDPLKYIVSTKGSAFVADREFTSRIFERTRDHLAEGEPVRITYPKVTENGLGDIILNYRKGSAVGGNEMVHVYNGDKWSRAKMVIKGSDASIPEAKKNYPYGVPVIANGEIYYGFSGRWREEKAGGALNKGVYLAKCGPTMTDDWEDPQGRKHKLPIEDYAPFLVADPETKGDKGSSGGPGIAVSAAGDVALSYRGRSGGQEYNYVFTRAAGATKFEETRGTAKIGTFWEDRMYAVFAGGDGTLTVRSKRLEDPDWRTDLETSSKVKFGGSVTKLIDGYLVFIAEDRTNPNTDKNKIHCYVFQVGTPSTVAQVAEKGVAPRAKRTLTSKEGVSVEAELVEVKAGKLICIVSGQRLEIPVSELIPEDVEYLKEWYSNR